MLGRTMAIMTWILILVLLSYFFQQWNIKQTQPQTPIISQAEGFTETILKRNENNQYVATGSVNQQPVVFLLDTGATDIVIPLSVAKKLKLRLGYEGEAVTAGGRVRVYSTRIKELQIGHITLKNLNATINPSMHGEEILLGMSALKKIRFTQEADTLILKSL